MTEPMGTATYLGGVKMPEDGLGWRPLSFASRQRGFSFCRRCMCCHTWVRHWWFPDSWWRRSDV